MLEHGREARAWGGAGAGPARMYRYGGAVRGVRRLGCLGGRAWCVFGLGWLVLLWVVSPCHVMAPPIVPVGLSRFVT